MRTQREAYLLLKYSALVIQRRFRANRDARRDRYLYERLKTVTIGLQAAARGHLFRQLLWPTLKVEVTSHRLLLIRSANTIKRTLMKRLANNNRQQFLELQQAVVTIQRWFRGRVQARKYTKLRATAKIVQQRFRANRAARQQRAEYLHIRNATIILQACARRFLARLRWPFVKRDLQTQQDQLAAASNTIKRFLRRCLPTTYERSEYLRLRQAVIMMQARYRAVVAARCGRVEYLRLRLSAIILQKKYRDRKANRAAIFLQAHVRGCLVRRQWPQLKNCLAAERKFEADSKLVSVSSFVFVLFLQSVRLINYFMLCYM